MSTSALDQSLAPGGAHHRLGQLADTWAGTARTWFEPDKLADESPITGTIRPVFDGRFALHEYRGSMQGKPLAGMAIHGYHLDFERWETAWIDSFHTGTSILCSLGGRHAGDAPASVLGHYAVPGGEPWGWRTTLEGRPGREATRGRRQCRFDRHTQISGDGRGRRGRGRAGQRCDGADLGSAVGKYCRIIWACR